MTVRELLRGLAPCEIPDSFLDAIGKQVGVYMDDNQAAVSQTDKYRLQARLYLYLSTLPNISEGGVSISFTATEKKAFLDLAKQNADLAGEKGLVPGTSYGYKGQNL